MQLQVIFRSNTQDLQPAEALASLGVTPATLKLRSLRSLMTSMEVLGQNQQVSAMTLTILDDHSDPEHLNQIAAMTHRSPLDPCLVSLEDFGSQALLRESLNLAQSSLSDFVYLVDDDQIHAPHALSQMLLVATFTSKMLGHTPLIVPNDTIQKYHDHMERYLFVCGERYWSSTPFHGGTVMLSRQTFNQYSVSKDPAHLLGIPCISPMPGLSIKLGGGGPTPQFIDWKLWWEPEDSKTNPAVMPSQRLPHLAPSEILAKHDLKGFFSSPFMET